jgi:hypothetical protein
MKSLVDLAFSVQEQARSMDSVSPMVQKALDAHRKEQEEAASKDIVETLRSLERRKAEDVRKVRRLKAELKRAKTGLDDLDRAWAYAQETANFLPLLAALGQIGPYDLPEPDRFHELTQVPSDFTPAGAGE